MRLLIGGSPCTYWSIAQTKNRETEASGMGWELFKNYVIARDKYAPDFFLYENNKSMSKEIREQITKMLGVEPICINSALVSAQNRQRLYWVGRRNEDGTYSKVNVEQPEDRGILLKDVLDGAVREKAHAVIASAGRTTEREFFLKNQGNMAAEPVNVNKDGKVVTQCGQGGGLGAKTGLYAVPVPVKEEKIGVFPNEKGELTQCQSKRIYSIDAKGRGLNAGPGGLGVQTGLYALPVGEQKCYAVPCEWDENGYPVKAVSCSDGKVYPVYKVENGEITIKDKQYPIKLVDGYYIIRKLTVSECMRLQTVPDWYDFSCVSNSQAYKMLGNGWTVEVIAHLMKHFDGITEQPVDVLSMYDGMACGHIALDSLGATIQRYRATEIDKYCIKTAMHNFPDIIQLGDAFQVRDTTEEFWNQGG